MNRGESSGYLSRLRRIVCDSRYSTRTCVSVLRQTLRDLGELVLSSLEVLDLLGGDFVGGVTGGVSFAGAGGHLDEGAASALGEGVFEASTAGT